MKAKIMHYANENDVPMSTFLTDIADNCNLKELHAQLFG